MKDYTAAYMEYRSAGKTFQFSHRWLLTNTLKEWQKWLSDKEYHHNIIREAVEEFIPAVRSGHRPADKFRREVAIIKKYFTFMFSEGLIPSAPNLNMPPIPVPPPVETKPLNEEQRDKMLFAISVWPINRVRESLYHGMIMGLETGLRFTDIRQMKWDQVSFKEMCIRVHPSKTRWRGGVGKMATIPMSNALKDYLNMIKKRSVDDLVSPMEFRNKEASEAALADLEEKMGFKCGAHEMRTTFITHWLVKRKVAPTILMGVTGHKCLNSLTHYMHNSLEESRAAMGLPEPE